MGGLLSLSMVKGLTVAGGSVFAAGLGLWKTGDVACAEAYRDEARLEQ